MKSKTKLRKIRERAGTKNAAADNMETVSTGFSPHWEGMSVRTRHTAVLGMCAFISAYPYDVPDFMPDVFAQLGVHLNDPEPIPVSIKDKYKRQVSYLIQVLIYFFSPVYN